MKEILSRREYHHAWSIANRERLRPYNRARQAKWRAANSEKVKSRRREMDAVNRDKLREQNRAWKAANPDKVRQSNARHTRKWRAANREKFNAQRARYKKANPHRFSAMEAIRRARKRLATIGDLTDIAKIYKRRDWWRQWFDVEVDHTIPLAKGGTHEASNLQIIYSYENKRKANSLTYKPRVIFT